MKTMDIESKEGQKVIFAYPNNGLDSQQEYAKNFLTVGNTYTVDFTDIGSWMTEVYLKEFPGKSFNSVLFANA